MIIEQTTWWVMKTSFSIVHVRGTLKMSGSILFRKGATDKFSVENPLPPYNDNKLKTRL